MRTTRDVNLHGVKEQQATLFKHDGEYAPIQRRVMWSHVMVKRAGGMPGGERGTKLSIAHSSRRYVKSGHTAAYVREVECSASP